MPWKVRSVILDGVKTPLAEFFTGTEFFLPAGEYAFALDSGSLKLIRTCSLARIEVSDGSGMPVQWVHVFRDLPGGRTLFQGATDSAGALTLRWAEAGDESLTLVREKDTMRATVKPGMQRIVFKK
jgi:hypothetical protein